MVIKVKKKILIIIATIIVIAAVGSMIYASISLNANQKELDSHLVELTLTELQDKVKNKESFVLIFTQTQCSHCASYKPKAKKVFLENNIIGYEIDLTKLTKTERAQLNEIANTTDNGTPTTVFIKDGVEERISNRLIGDQEEYKLLDKLKKLGYIEE